MDQIGLENNLINYAQNIDIGRKGLRIPGQEAAGRINYEDGITRSISIFTDAQISGNAELLIMAELYFLKQELSFCEASDTPTISSLTQAIQSFEDALHTACIAHRTRLGNMDRVPGINPLEKAFFQVRKDNMTAVQNIYLAKQKTALGD
ncbi:hypothetical protein LQZ19_15665 [Treponema primitia]|uniref:hypothetical protein n=1 Tax=Treponema primitia TaxID=88058 RepID=UPI003980C1E5